MRIRRFNESAGDEGDGAGYEAAKQWVVDNYDEARVIDMLDQEILEWVDQGQMEDEGYESEYDWYIDYGMGEAESAVADDIVRDLRDSIDIGFDPKSDDTPMYAFLRQAYPCLDY